MPLQTVAGTPGLWRDPDWKPDMPGVYALVVGASNYPHLDGGQQKAPDTFDMGQLVSSARTAAALFEWLRDDFRHQDLRVVWCQLLLSPTDDEKADIEPAVLAHHAPADNETFRKAIQRWTGNTPKADAAAQQSRTLFFFSGHGVLSNWRPLMLPSDYLDPSFGAPQFENCISTRELLEWMEQSPVAEHLALIDACQNQFSPLASKGATANSCFPVHPPGGKVPRTAAALASTSPNAIAYQLKGHDHTFFGAAVLEALRGAPGDADTRLEFRELVDYVRPRVNALLRAAGGTALEQTVRPRIEGDDVLVVTELGAVTPPAAIAPPAPGGATRSRPRAARPAAARSVRQPVDLSLANKSMAERFDDALGVHDPISLDEMRADFGKIHDRMGHEYASHPWQSGLALYALRDRSKIAGDGTEVRAVERNRESSLVQVDLALGPREGGVLLVFEGEHFVQRDRLAVALPTDSHARVPVRLTLTFGATDSGSGPTIQRIEARLGPSGEDANYHYLWQLTREADLSSLRAAAERADPERLKDAARQKMTSQTAAVAGMLLLARAGRIGDVGDWTRNLMKWFPDIPDGAVLWAESLRAAMAQETPKPFGVAQPADEMADALGSLAERGLPFFADVLELTDSLLRFALRHDLSDARRNRLIEVQKRLERLFQAAIPSGHFVALAGRPVPEMFELLGR